MAGVLIWERVRQEGGKVTQEEDVRVMRGPQAQGGESSLKAGKCKEMNTPLEPPEGRACRPTSDF